jgi:hypothetical protein
MAVNKITNKGVVNKELEKLMKHLKYLFIMVMKKDGKLLGKEEY